MEPSTHFLADCALRLWKRDRDKGLTQAEAARHYGITTGMVAVRNHHHKYPRVGKDKISASNNRLVIPDQDRLFMLLEAERRGVAFTARAYTLTEPTLRCWRSRALAGEYGLGFKQRFERALGRAAKAAQKPWTPPVIAEGPPPVPQERFLTMADLMASGA